MLVWDWPKGKMAWFFWNWRPSILDRARYWRIGPITLTVIDDEQSRSTN